MEETNTSIFDFDLDDEAKSSFKTISVWAVICAITGFITVGLSVYSLAKSLWRVMNYPGSSYVTGFLAGSAISVITAFFLNFFLLQFGNKISRAFTSGSQEEFNNGLRNFKMYIRFLGILLIVIIATFVILFLIGLLYRR